MQTLADEREERRRAQTAVAAAMATSQSTVARLESSTADAGLSTIERDADTLGYVVQYHLIPADEGVDAAPVVVHKAALELKLDPATR